MPCCSHISCAPPNARPNARPKARPDPRRNERRIPGPEGRKGASMTTAPAAVASDLEIARSVKPRPILDVARELGLHDDEIEPYGTNKAKIRLEAIARLEAERPRGKY